MVALSYRAFRDEPEDHVAFQTLERTGFGTPDDHIGRWKAAIGPQEIRFAEVDGTPAAMGSWIDMGYRIGGTAVGCGGITAVNVGTTYRGSGVGRFLMESMIAEAAGRGWPIVSLYASTPAFYRKVGFEIAGWYTSYDAPVANFVLPQHKEDQDVEVRPLRTPAYREGPPSPELIDQVAPLYDGALGCRAGGVQASRFGWWGRLQKNGEALDGVMVEGDNGIEAYATLDLRATRGTLVLAGWSATTRRGLRALAHWIAGFRSIFDTVTWRDAPNSPLALLIPDRGYTCKEIDPVLVRVVNVEALLKARGYPVTASAKLGIAVEDPVLPNNSGGYLLRIEAGQVAQLDRFPAGYVIDAPMITIGPRGLAGLLSGGTSAAMLHLLNLVEGNPAALAIADGLFSGPLPGTSDHW